MLKKPCTYLGTEKLRVCHYLSDIGNRLERNVEVPCQAHSERNFTHLFLSVDSSTDVMKKILVQCLLFILYSIILMSND